MAIRQKWRGRREGRNYTDEQIIERQTLYIMDCSTDRGVSVICFGKERGIGCCCLIHIYIEREVEAARHQQDQVNV